jgi:hypothetical protein
MTMPGTPTRVALALMVVLVGCSALSGCSGSPSPKETKVIVTGADLPVALVPAGGDRFVFAERITGALKRASLDGNSEPSVIATIETEGQPGDDRGLLGVAVDETDRVFAAYTRRGDHRLVVAQVAPDGTRIVWEGPETPEHRIGGHLVYLDGRLFLVIGELGDPSRIDDPASPHGKLLQLIPDGPPAQRPVVVSAGWRDPTFTLGPGRDWWIADRAGGDDRKERLAHIVPGLDPVVTELASGKDALAPTALVSLPGDRMGLCSAARGKLVNIEVRAGRAGKPGYTVAEPCTLAAVALPDGRVLMSTDQQIRIFTP